MYDLKTIWRHQFGEVPPLGHVLRHICHDRWVRFHALPEGKRYADTSEEEAEILTRANAIAVQLFQPNDACWLVTEAWRADPPLPGWNEEWTWREDDPEDAFEAYFTSFRASLQHWQAGCLDSMFHAIANDEIRAIAFNAETGAVLAPYDGGFDVICPNLPSKMALRERLAPWLSPRSDGL